MHGQETRDCVDVVCRRANVHVYVCGVDVLLRVYTCTDKRQRSGVNVVCRRANVHVYVCDVGVFLRVYTCTDKRREIVCQCTDKRREIGR